MSRYLFDSNAIDAYVRRMPVFITRAKRVKAEGGVFGTALPVYAEFLGGAMASDTARANVPKVRLVLDKLTIWPFDLAAAEEYARLYAELRRKGITIGAIDLQAAAIARTLGSCTVVTCDSDFSHVPGLNVENWMASEPHA